MGARMKCLAAPLMAVLMTAPGYAGTGDGGDIRDITGPLAPGGWLTDLFAGAILAAGLLLALLVRRRGVPEAELPADRPSSDAFLDDLEAELTAGTGSAVCQRLADLVRGWLEERTGLAAFRLTTAELLAGSAALGVDRRDRLGAILATCDLAKFAGQEPTVPEVRRAIALARTLMTPGAGDGHDLP